MDKAITKYKEALEVKLDFFDSYWRIGYMYALQEDYAEAMNWNLENFFRDIEFNFGSSELKEWDTSRWGYLSWEVVEKFCRRHQMTGIWRISSLTGDRFTEKALKNLISFSSSCSAAWISIKAIFLLPLNIYTSSRISLAANV